MKTKEVAAIKFIDFYNDLNETKKSLFRTAFIEEHGFAESTLYGKINGNSFFRPNEQKWICQYFELTANEIQFPIQ